MSESFSPSTQTNPRGAQGHFFCSTMHQNNDLCVMVKLVAFTHVWIALGAFGAAAATVLGHGHAVEEWSVFTWSGLTGIGVATGCVYTLQRRIKLRKNPSGIPRERRVFLERWENPMAWGWSMLAVAWAWACAPEWRSAVGLALDHPAVLFGVATLALGYASNPITGGRGWRDIPRLKWPVIALAWGLVTGWLPLQFLPSMLHSVNGLRLNPSGCKRSSWPGLPSPSMCATSPSTRRNCEQFRSNRVFGSPQRWPSHWSC